MTPKKKAVTGAVCLTAAALLFSGTFAWVSGVQEATNQFVKDDYKVTLHDVLDGTPVTDGGAHQVNWAAGSEVNKDIWVSNEGSDDILVRVKLTETMKLRKGAEELVNVKDAVHGSEADTLHDYVTWTTGSVKTYDEWKALSKDEQHGSYWVLADDGYAYWMQPLAPSGEEDTAGAAGNTGLLLDAVTLKEGQEGAVEYTIQVEMDAIDAKLAGLTEEGATWTSDAAKALAAAAVYDPIAEEIQRIDAELASPPTEEQAYVSAYVKQKEKARDFYVQAQSATDAEQRDRLLYDAKWYDLLAETQYINGDYVVNSNATGGQFIMKVTNRTPSTGSIQEVCDCTLIMYYNGDSSSQCKTLSVPQNKVHSSSADSTVRQYKVTAIQDGALKYFKARNLNLTSWDDRTDLLTEHTFDGLTATYVVKGSGSSAVKTEFLNDFKAGKYGKLANEVPENNYVSWAK